VNKELEKIIKNLKGNLIGIGIKEENLIKLIEKNDNIFECNLLDCIDINNEEKGKNKKVKIKKLRKKFKKRRTNYIICNYKRICEFKEKFIYDSIYICNKEIYIYSEEYIESIERRYNRFCKTEISKTTEGYIYKININKKMNKFNELYYKTLDNIISIIDFISNILT